MDRRDFFRRSAGKAVRAVTEHVNDQVQQNAAHWIRPPFALDELDFLLACTRCKACTEACRYHVIFPLPARRGAQVVGTPVMNLLNQACHLCQDWPCVQACEAGALKRPVIETDDEAESNLQGPVWPKLARVSINEKTCLPYAGPECGACRGSCPVPGALLWQSEKPVIEQTLCSGCALCREACIVEPRAIRVQSRQASLKSV
ncbi:hypothetical protein MNBD_GAMMA24-776 [hydrothermal vent metagenome]|uniref:4Fe-4S ferredoxin-type domain-containing protein n=1 Tax=hydrothermal vent metagenome TaxID=652676 RepID=A0A3B1B141_9ZZZZ